MKLYATVTSERGGRPAKKGGNNYVNVEITVKGKHVGTLTVWETRMQLLKLSAYRNDEKGNPLVLDARSIEINEEKA